MLKLTSENYYTPEADKEYLSCSQYEDFLDCEARAMAKIQKRFVDKPSDAFLVGNYFHTAMEGEEAHEEFKKLHFDEIYKTKTKIDKKTGPAITEITGKYAKYEEADIMIEAARNDPKIKQLIDMPGDVERIMTGKLFGRYPWKIRLDKYIPKMRTIIDWKTVQSITETRWDPAYREHVSFIRAYDYVMRAAVYVEIEKQVAKKESDAVFLLVPISKQDPPDKDIFIMNNRQEFDLELERIEERIGRIQRIKDGIHKPRRCGTCAYCRQTKEIREMKPFFVLDPASRPPREDDYAMPEVTPNELPEPDAG